MGNDETRSLREKLGWSQERLARELGVSFSTVNRWERGRASPSPMALKNLKKLKEEHGVANKRNSVRLELRYPIGIRVNRGLETAEAFNHSSHTENLSIGGLMFRKEADFKAGDILHISLDLGGNRPVRTVSEVVWILENGLDRAFGVRFNKINHQDMVRVMNTILVNKP